MMTSEQARMMMEFFANPMFKQGSEEFFKIAQQQGMDAAKKFWGDVAAKNAFPNAEKMLEGVSSFYESMGFVPLAKYEALLKEHGKLQAETQILRDALRELQQSFVAENGAKAQQAWQEIVDKQLEMSREVTKSFFDVMKQSSPPKGE